MSLSPDGKSLKTFLLVNHAHGSEHVVLEAVGSVQLEGGLSSAVQYSSVEVSEGIERLGRRGLG